MKDQVIGKIYQTTDYDKFKRLKGNRDVSRSGKVVESIEKVGYILSPILVNENFEVIDGQNRLQAVKELKLPVKYMVQPGIGIDECRALNINQSNWSTEQFIASYAENGYSSYERLYSLIRDFKGKGFSLEGILLLTSPHLIQNGAGTHYGAVKTGEYKLSDERYDFARNRLASCMALGFVDFKDKYDMLGRTYWGAVSYAYEHREVNIKALARKMFENPKEIISVSKVSDQLRYFEDAYNKGVRATNKVYMSTDFLKRKYITGKEYKA